MLLHCSSNNMEVLSIGQNRSIEHPNDTKPKEHTMSSADYPVGQVKTTWTSKSFMSPRVDPWLQCFMPEGSRGT